jgi:hypothetical protein
MLSLGCVDANVSDAQCAAYLKDVETLTRKSLKDVQAGIDRVQIRRVPSTPGALTVSEVQQRLKDLGFFPGGRVDGICGYRTQSAIRLFQEHVRSIEKLDCLPDGQFGPKSQQHLERWTGLGKRPSWDAAVTEWSRGSVAGEFASWLEWLNIVKAKCLADPSPVLELVNAYPRSSDTHKVVDWNFSPRDAMHLIGIRRQVMTGKFDDIFVLLIKGLVFKFQGTTEPGASDHPAGKPFLVPGQHDYHFGWHKSTYLALKPESVGSGVLVLRAGADGKITPDDLQRGLEANNTINIHWGGRGLKGDVKHWSEGCQVVTGSVYVNHESRLIDCRQFAAVTPDEARDPASKKTRAAYNTLVDLVIALGSDLEGGKVKYTLVEESYLSLLPSALRQHLVRMGQEMDALP